MGGWMEGGKERGGKDKQKGCFINEAMQETRRGKNRAAPKLSVKVKIRQDKGGKQKANRVSTQADNICEASLEDTPLCLPCFYTPFCPSAFALCVS